MTSAAEPADEIWFARPARVWTEALPLGNGRLGAMAFGGPLTDRFQINDGTAWSGSPASEDEPPIVDAAAAAAALAEARAAALRNDHPSTDAALQRLQHRHSQSYLPFVDLRIKLAPTTPRAAASVTRYRRALRLDSAVHTVDYLLDGHVVRATSFVSRPHGVLVLRITTDYPGGLDLVATLDSQLAVIAATAGPRGGCLELAMPSDVVPLHDESNMPVTYDTAPSLRGAVAARWCADGIELPPVPGVDTVGFGYSGTKAAMLVLATETTFTGIGRMPAGSAADALIRALDCVDRAERDGYDTVARAQWQDHNSLYCKAHLTLGSASAEPTDQRLREAAVHAGGVAACDPGLIALLFNFGRYLLISSSRSGGLPANLQGIWNDELRPAWGSNYTININLEMNYWAAEVTGLGECAAPLFDLIDAVAASGQETADRLYAAPGWVAHHNTDAWAYTQPVGNGRFNPAWAFWPLGGTWLIQHIGEHLRFGGETGDAARAFAERAWPVVRGATEFLLAWLVELPDGSLATVPATSPENRFVDNGQVGSAAVSSTMDLSLAADVFELVGLVAGLVGQEADEIVLRAAAALRRLPGPPIGRDGTISEWRDDFDQFDPHHRHLSHLYFAYPGRAVLAGPVLDAVIRSLDARADESTAWSLVWKIALRARTGQADRICRLIDLLFRQPSDGSSGIYPNLLTTHPPFQIDGNLGFVGAVAECLVQSHRGRIDLLPTLPAEFGSGAVTGLVARPGLEIDLKWSAGQLNSVTLRARNESGVGDHQIAYAGRFRRIHLRPGQEVTLSGSDLRDSTRPPPCP